MSGYDVEAVRKDFPILSRQVRGKPLAYLDNAATTQKPEVVIDTICRYYREYNANVHRGVHALSEEATASYEATRARIASWIGAARPEEIIYTRGTTEAVNLAAHSYGRKHIGSGDEVVITILEHHSNLLPWKFLCDEVGATLRVAPVNDRGELILEEYEKLLGPRTKMVAMTHISNSLGTINPVKRAVEMARERNIPVLLDGAQSAAHVAIDVQDLDCDFYAISSHKMFGPTGIGALYAKSEHLERMIPYQSGGDMIIKVTFEKVTLNQLPFRFEAGTPNIAGVIGFGAAVDYLQSLDMDAVEAYEKELLQYATDAVTSIEGIRIIGTALEKAAVISFVMEGAHPHDIATILDREGVAVRAGHHCTQPALDRFGLTATTRASLALYNNRQDVDALVRGLHKVAEVFR